MANYYHEARAHAKNIRLMQDDNRRRAERRAEKAGVEVNHLSTALVALPGLGSTSRAWLKHYPTCLLLR